jgi:hypothetical protein
VSIPTTRPSGSRSGPPEDPGASGAVCSTLPPIRLPPGPRNDRSTAETKPSVSRTPAGGANAAARTGCPTASATLDHSSGQVAVRVDPEHAPGFAPTVREAQGGLVAPEVVRIRQHPPGADDEAGSPEPPADADDRRSGLLRGGRYSGPKIIEKAHLGMSPHAMVSCKLQHTTNH